MSKSLCVVVVASIVAALPVAAAAEPAKGFRGQDRASAFMRIYGPTLPPYGFVRFCEVNPRECAVGQLEEARFNADHARLLELDHVNRDVNARITAATDQDTYGVTEHWAIPTARGDCEDYALLKRQILISHGWPRSALLITVVRDEKGEGHAVLTARTAQGDFILDNKTDELRLWHKVPYTYVMRQSYVDPRVWVSLDPKDARSPTLLSGVKAQR